MRSLLLLSLLGFQASRLAAVDALSADDVFQFFAAEKQVVTATRFKSGLKETPASVSVITAEEIARHGYRTLGEALVSIPGLYANSDRSYEFLGVRGMNVVGDWSSRVLILVDGMTTNDPLYGSGYIGDELGIDMSAVKRIEVVMGPGSALYGAHAMFAVVQIITKDGEDQPGLRLGGGYGTGASKELSGSFGAHLSNGADYFAQAAWLGSDGLDHYVPEYGATASGTDYLTAFKSVAKVSLEGLSLELGANRRRKGLTNTGGYSIFGETRSNQIDQGAFMEAKAHRNLSPTLTYELSLVMRAYSYEGRYMSDYGYLEEYISTAEAHSLLGQLQVDWQPFDGDWLSVGVEQQDNDVLRLQAYDKGFSDPSNYFQYLDQSRPALASSFFLQDIYKPLAGLTLVLGGRTDEYSAFGRTWNPRAGILYSFSDAQTLKLLYGRAFNPPNNYQLYYNDGGLTTLDNPGLQPEIFESLEAVYELDLGAGAASLSAFQNTVRGLIVAVADANSGVTQYQNRASTRTQGLELKTRAEWQGLRVRAGGCLQRTVDSDLDSEVGNSPRETVNAGVSAPVWGPAAWLSADFVYVGNRGVPQGGSLSPYQRVDLALYAPKLLGHADLTLKVRNAGDMVYSDPSAGGTQLSYEQDRRSYQGRLELGF